jgi:hypothetical protein
MDWPFIENRNNFIIDYHIVYAVVCIYLIKMRAARVGPRRLGREASLSEQRRCGRWA